MPLKKISFKTNPNEAGQRLDLLLSTRLPALLQQPISKGKVRKLIIAGAVYLNGKRVRIASKEVFAGAKVDVFADLQRLESDSASRDTQFEMTEKQILFEDEFLIAVDKPAGIPTQPTVDEARNNLFAAVRKFLAHRQGVPPGQIYLALHHRLDRDTSGVLLLSKSEEANPGLAKIFSTHLAEKTYNALSSGSPQKDPPTTWKVENFLGRVDTKGKRARFGSVRSGGDAAQTDFKILERFPLGYWIEARPRTGRTHQIRVHLSESGLPILGDAHYGGASSLAGMQISRTMLHAVALTFPHPIHQNRISIQSAIPGDFSQCLKVLRKGHRDF